MLAYLFVAAVILARLLFRPLAFAPVVPALLFFSAYIPRKQMWIPLALLAAADVYLTKIAYSYPLTADHFVSWAWYATILWLGGAWLKGKARPLRVAAAALTGSVSFFVVSNFAVWAVWNMYPKTLGGLSACYVAAIPFFRNQAASDLVFTAVMFAAPLAMEALRPSRAEDHVRAA